MPAVFLSEGNQAARSNCSSSLCFHSHATVPHIVALLGFSFHVAKIESIFVNSKFLSSECNKCLHLYCWVVKKFARRVKFLRGNLSKSHFFLVLFDKITFFYYLCRQLPAIVVVRPLVACSRKGLKKQRMLQSISLWEQRAGMIFVGKLWSVRFLFKTSLKLGREIDDYHLIRSECSRV